VDLLFLWRVYCSSDFDEVLFNELVKKMFAKMHIVMMLLFTVFDIK